MKVSAEEIEAAKSPKGSWTKETLAKWGVPWPAPKGWKQSLINGTPLNEQSFKTPALRARYSDSLEAHLLHKLALAVIESGNGILLNDVDGLSEYFGSSMPTVADVIGSRPKHAVITGGITFDDKVYSFTCARKIA